ncbi:hypothetical protein [Qipengyuania sp.]|uniref:hypothetical protein n=1 Tax=Qipengyuania sp. TaxID=2004515 RepID=UPI003736CB8B
MNRLRPHFADQQAQKARRRLQGDIVRDYRDDIVELLADDGATLSEVALAVRARGEPVLDHGFKAEILKQIGTVKNIRSGHAKVADLRGASPVSEPQTQKAKLMPSLTDAAEAVGDDDDQFAARRRRG